MRRELTDVWLRGVKAPATGRLEIWDARTAGLVLRITPNGIATWSVRARTIDGKRTRPKLGTWPAVGIAEARRRALATTANIQAGGDPVVDRRTAKAERLARATIPTVAERLAEWQMAKASRWSDRYCKEVERLCRIEFIPKLGDLPLADTARRDWTELIATKQRRAPATASLLYRVTSAFLGHAEAHGWISLPLLPRKGLAIIAPPPDSRVRVLTDSELTAVWNATDALRPKARTFVRLLAMTACRASEAADISTGEVNLDSGRWAIPGTRTKNGKGLVVPLHPVLVSELEEVWPIHGATAGTTWRLLGDIAGNGYRSFSKLKSRVDKQSGVADWRWHDLRRTARTGMARLGVSRDHAEAALNHISGRSILERTYDRYDYEPEVIVALQRWQCHVATLVGDPHGQVRS